MDTSMTYPTAFGGRPSELTESGLLLERVIIAAAKSLMEAAPALDALDAKVI